MKHFHARLHILLAREAPIGLVIRRGPSKRVATILWNRETDKFQLGQWLKGRIYEHNSDLSPDGKYFIYFALNGQWESEGMGAWTAISRAPYLKALTLFPKGDCWYGGGLWVGPHEYWLNGTHLPIFHDSKDVRVNSNWVPAYRDEQLGIYFQRLMRDGWKLKEKITHGNVLDGIIFEKPYLGGWALRKYSHLEWFARQGKGSQWDDHELIHYSSGTSIPFPDWEWADVDNNRLVWATEGRLEEGLLTDNGLVGRNVLYDFNEMTFTAIEAPY